ncbi:MAG: anthranilate phosphoribosyltransferase, partial [Actinomycetota bacterium]|nr:anthranilate phosphoribosyltransferase [Actinomycetota bacterium]
VVIGEEGIDEFSVSGRSLVAELKDGMIKKYIFDPEELGFKKSAVSELTGGDAKVNAKILTDILTGEEKGPKRDSAVINAAAAIVSGKKADSLKEALELAFYSIESGRAYDKLNELVRFTSKKAS